MGLANAVLNAGQKTAGAVACVGMKSDGSIADTPAKVSAFQASIATGSVQPVTPSKNLFNWREVVEGFYMGNDGSWAALSGYGVSGFIPVTPGLQYVVSDGVNASPARFTAYFDANKQSVAGGSNTQVSTFTPPVGAAFVRITYNIGGRASKYTVQVEQASTPTSYAPFLIGVKNGVVSLADIPQVSKSQNLFDKTQAIDGVFMDASGNISASASFGLSGFIPVKSGSKYVISDHLAVASAAVAANNIARFTTYFDSNKLVVAGGASSSTFAMQIPVGVAFVRFSYNIGTAANGVTYGKDSIQFEESPNYVASTYKPFQYGLETDGNYFDQTPKMVIWGAERLRRWNAWRLNQDSDFDILLGGDSWTDGNYWCNKLRNQILTKGGFTDGGPGLLCFSFADQGAVASQSIDSTQLSCLWTTGDWTANITTSWGINGVDVTSAAAGKTITITANTTLSNLTLVYKKVSGGAGFTYSINGGGAVTVSTANATAAIGSTTIDTSALSAPFTVTISALGSGVSLTGAIGRKSGSNRVTLHKAGMTGSRAQQFATDILWKDAVTLLSPKMAVFMWGTNEMNANDPPSLMAAHIQRLASLLRSYDPYIDLLFCGPPQQTYGSSENPRTYTADDYSKAMFQLAQKNNGAFIGHALAWGPFSQATIDNGFLGPDRVHPGTRGSWLLTSTKLKALGF